MKFTATLLTLSILPASLALAQSQIVVPDNTPVAISSDNGTNELFVGQSTTLANGSSANTFLGSGSGQGNTSGARNTFLGLKAGFPNTTGSNNTFVGFESGKNNIDGSDNVFMGFNAGQSLRNGRGNSAIGVGAGAVEGDGNNNTYLGFNAGSGKGLSNATAIGANARVMSSNALILGNGANVGIGNSAPNSLLELTARNENQSGLRFTHLTASSAPQTQVAEKFLTVSDKGDVVLANKLTSSQLVVRAASAKAWADYVFEKKYSLQPLAEVEQYIRQHGHLPGIPTAADMASTGVELTTLLTTLVQKNEELTLHLIAQQKQITALQKQLRTKKRR
ncbi:hypothetical protein J2I47_18175 [Fibrella sp. HMF5335]|uniref:Head domain of trimeric autotransporter adhesin n=1 Tax=Fibrella rubiginis TaxID=2817060 RepID=A0A939K4J4_9BACT|nr:hypothetical protein [Fibrella rubiginis]MBO0938484.1 hypothetical protein [Fibrella rubiginis]